MPDNTFQDLYPAIEPYSMDFCLKKTAIRCITNNAVTQRVFQWYFFMVARAAVAGRATASCFIPRTCVPFCLTSAVAAAALPSKR